MFEDGFDAMEAGAAYALYRHGQDRQTEEIVEALRQRQGGSDSIDVYIHHDDEDEEPTPVINALDFTTADMPQDWDDYKGQGPLKEQILIRIQAAKKRGSALPHILLASGFPGVGKTTLARLIAKSMGSQIIELVPPFGIDTVIAAGKQLGDRDILFIDEVHKLADNGTRGAEILLKVLEDKVAFLPSGEIVEFADFTIIAATTEKDKLPDTILDRFKIKPYFQRYTTNELAVITLGFAYKEKIGKEITEELLATIALACRGTPRICHEFVLAVADLLAVKGTVPSWEELLAFMEVEPDGLTRTHIHYLTALVQYFPRTNKDGTVEFVAGEASMMQILRETPSGIARIERFLIEQGLVDRTPRGRRLTHDGLARALTLMAQGKGASDVA